MKILLIDPYIRAVTVKTLRSVADEFVELRQIARLHNGDVLFAPSNRVRRQTFALGNGEPIVARGMLIGKRIHRQILSLARRKLPFPGGRSPVGPGF
jgi:hypothetical protein